MFIQNKYYRWYTIIITRATDRILNGYNERHHIVPRSLGGTDLSSNIVSLTAREHFICHRLLCKFTNGKNRSKMVLGLKMMMSFSKTHQGYRYEHMTARSFEVFRIELSSVISDFKKGVPLTGQALTNVRAAAQRPERNAKISAAQKGRVFPGDRIKLSASVSATMTPEHRVHLAEKARQRPPISNETRAKMSKSHMGQTHPNFSHPGEKNPFFGKTHSQETKAKLSASSKGRPSAWKGAIVSDEIRAKISAGKRGRTPKKVIVTCPHCGKEGASTIMPRYHFNKCKLKPVML